MNRDVPPPDPRGAASRRSRLWLLCLLAAVVGGGIAAAAWFGSGSNSQQPGEMLLIHVRPAGIGEAILIDDPAGVPVRAGGCMNLEVQYRESARTYLLWIDCHGRLQPLYPWNTDRVEMTDLSQPVPQRRGAKVVNSPLSFGGAWSFGEGSGVETVLLLSRREPLPESVKLDELFTPLPPPVKAGSEKELVILEVRDHAKEVTTVLSRDRGGDSVAKAADEPLTVLLLRLAPHFDLVRAVRFAHVEAEDKAK